MPAGPAIERAIAEIGRITDPHRAIDWLSTFPQVVLIAAGRAAVRFQDAAKDARTVVYAGIQADPVVAPGPPTLLADATPAQRVLARAVMNGETTDPDGWRVDLPDPVLRRRPPGRPTRARSEAILACALQVADRGDEIRNQLRGAIVEALTERLLARRAAGGHGPSRAPHPVRRRPGRRSTRTT